MFHVFIDFQLFQTIAYKSLLHNLEISNVRELEDFIIEAIESSIIKAKINQQKQLVIVESAMGRDVPMEKIDSLLAVLDTW